MTLIIELYYLVILTADIHQRQRPGDISKCATGMAGNLGLRPAGELKAVPAVSSRKDGYAVPFAAQGSAQRLFSRLLVVNPGAADMAPHHITFLIDHHRLGSAATYVNTRIQPHYDSSICSTKASILVMVCSSEKQRRSLRSPLIIRWGIPNRSLRRLAIP